MQNRSQNKKLINLPLSSNQKRLWIISQIHKSNPSYNLGFTYHLRGKLDESLFQKSIGVLFNRHQSMFSVFKQDSGNPYCEIVSMDVSVKVVDLSINNPAIRKQDVSGFIGNDVRIPFNIEISWTVIDIDSLNKFI